MKNIGPINTWLINYISKVTRKITGGFKDEVVSLFNTNTPEQTIYRRGKKLSKPKAQNKITKKEEKNIDSKERIIRDILTFYETQKDKKEKKKLEEKNKLLID